MAHGGYVRLVLHSLTYWLRVWPVYIGSLLALAWVCATQLRPCPRCGYNLLPLRTTGECGQCVATLRSPESRRALSQCD